MLKISAISIVAVAAFFSAAAYAADIGGAKDGEMKFFEPSKGLVKWTGPYIGVHGGYGWADTKTTDDIADWCSPTDTACIDKYVGPFNYDAEGIFGGGTIGYNVLLRNILIGAEVDLGYMDLNGDQRIASSSASPHYQTLSLDGGVYGVLAGRLGMVFDRLLVYGKGGFAFYDGEATQTTTKTGFTTTETDTFTGWAYGGGVEYALTDSLSVKVEYLRFDFDQEDAGQIRDSDGYDFNNTNDLSVDTVKIGINHRF